MVKKVIGIIRNNQHLLGQYLTVISGNSVGRGLSLVTSLMLARWLGVEGFGEFSIFFTMTLLVWQLPTVLDVAYVRYVRADASGDTIEYLRCDVVIKSAVFILLLLLAYPAGHFLGRFIFNKPELSLFLTAAIVCGVSISLFSTLGAIFQAQERFKLFSVVSLAFYAIVFLAVIALGAKAGQMLTAAKAVLIYTVVSVAVGLFGIVYLLRKVKPLLPLHLQTLFKMFHFGKWLLAEQCTYIVLQRLDVLFLARFSDYAQVGIYSAAVRIAMLASLLTGAASSVFMPRGCESLNSLRQLKRYRKESLTVAAGLSVCIAIIIGFAPLLIHLCFGAQYSGSVGATRILLLEAVCVLFYAPFSYLFYAAGNTRQVFYLGAMRLVVAIGSLAVFVPLLGSTGAAWALALSSLSVLIAVVFLSQKTIAKATVAFNPA